MTDVLNLGAGGDIRQDTHNVDVVDLAGIDAVVDLDEYPWPWRDNQWDRVLAKHVLEHLQEPVQALQEIARIVTPGGTLELWYPIGHTRFEDPTHRHYWNWHTAAAIAGERKHGHEHVDGLTLDEQTAVWNVDTLHWRAYTTLRERVDGPGPWFGQVPGLYGNVVAHYEVTR